MKPSIHRLRARILGIRGTRLSPAKRVGRLLGLVLVIFAASGCAFAFNPTALTTRPVTLFNPPQPVGFDEMMYDPGLAKVIVPAAESGKMALVDPNTLAVNMISGFSVPGASAAKSVGTTSAATGRGVIFAIDKGSSQVDVIDPSSGTMIANAPLQSVPDFIRFVAATNELWVTERASEQIEIFSVPAAEPFTPVSIGTIKVPNGPEGLAIDRSRGLAYTNQPKLGLTTVIQVQTHGIIAQWGNGCSQGRGLVLDEQHGYLFVACREGKVVMLDTLNNGQQITSQTYGGGVDFIAYNPQLEHLYLPSPTSAILAIFEVQVTIPTPQPASSQGAIPPAGTLSPGANAAAAGTAAPPSPKISLVRLGTADTSVGARCVTADDHGNIWVCDPAKGQLLMIHDSFPAGGESPG